MKHIISVIIAVAAAAFILGSCTKDETYPSHLSGTWTYSNGSTGYTGTLKIEDLDGGQKATFALKSPGGNADINSEGSFSYDSTTGEGSIVSNMIGAPKVNVKAKKGSDKELDITVNQIVSGGTEPKFEGTFSK